MANFLCDLSDSSSRPASLLKSALAAMAAMYAALDMPALCRTEEIRRLVTALIKSGTRIGMRRSSVMPVQPFLDLFREWPQNSDLPIKDLRAKCICLLALTLMLRPSDIAPKSVQYDSDKDHVSNLVFHENQISFTPDGVKLVFLGIKNDMNRAGFDIFLPMGSDPKLDPVLALKAYMDRTAHMRALAKGAVFLTLTRPFHSVTASVVARILNSVIKLAGLDGRGFSAKSFRPTGATIAVAQGFDVDKVRRLGRWKTQSVFLEHYVHNNIDKCYIDDVFKFGT
jgi:hypothetical protein